MAAGKDPSEIKTTSVNLVLGPKGVSLDASGRISFLDPEILQALVSAAPTDRVVAASEGNTVQCVCNNYQCGKKFADVE
jgi:hypothetical protein